MYLFKVSLATILHMNMKIQTSTMMIIVQLLHMLLLLHPHHLLNHHHQYLRLDTKNSVMSTAKKQKMNNDNNCDDGPSSLKSIKAGFIGCGTIASAIATSLATPDHKTHLSKAGYSLQSISVTRRSESKSSKLKENFEDVVTVYESAEEVVLNSNLIFLCVLPQQVDGVLEELTMKGVWKSDHTLVSLVVRVCVSFDLNVGVWWFNMRYLFSFLIKCNPSSPQAR